MGSFLALVAALFAMWAWRFERLPGLSTWHLADLRDTLPPTPGADWTGTPGNPGLRLRTDGEGDPLSIRLSIPQAPALDSIHLRFRISSHGLTPGNEAWQDGRFMVEWHQPLSGTIIETDSVGSIRHDIQGNLQDLVVQPFHRSAVPVFRLEHLGLSGEFELTDLEITAVRERTVWKSGRWFLALAWLAWITAFIRSWPGISIWRAVFAAAIWVSMGIHFVIPGPWKIQRPMVPAFQLGEKTTLSVPDSSKPVGVPLESGPLPALGKLSNQGSLALRVKLAASHARPLLHAFLLFAPTLLFLFLVGRRPALMLSAALAVSIELAQIAFGYGFDLIDVGDLVTDAAGIALALWAWGKIVARSAGRGRCAAPSKR